MNFTFLCDVIHEALWSTCYLFFIITHVMDIINDGDNEKHGSEREEEEDCFGCGEITTKTCVSLF